MVYSSSKSLILLLLGSLPICMLLGMHFKLSRKQRGYYSNKYYEASGKYDAPILSYLVFVIFLKTLCKTTPLQRHDSKPRLLDGWGQDLYQLVKCFCFVHKFSRGQTKETLSLKSSMEGKDHNCYAYDFPVLQTWTVTCSSCVSCHHLPSTGRSVRPQGTESWVRQIVF